jgi:hypothetical protein
MNQNNKTLLTFKRKNLNSFPGTKNSNKEKASYFYFSILKVFTDRQNTLLLILLCASFTISLSIFTWGENMISHITGKLKGVEACVIDINEHNIDEYLAYPKVRFFLFTKEDSYFKVKYGPDFELENLDPMLIKNEILKVANNSLGSIEYGKPRDKGLDLTETVYQLRDIIKESINYNTEMRIRLLLYLVNAIFLITCAVSICLLLSKLKVELGYLKSLTTILSVLFMTSAVFMCLKFTFKTKKSKEEGDDNI